MSTRPWLRALRTPMGALAGVLIVLVLAVAVIAPLLWGDRANLVDTTAIQQGPSAAHPIGTDELGRDLLARVFVATRLSVALAILATLIGVAIGVLLGTAPSLLPRRAGRLVAAIVDIAVAFPGLLLALFFAVVFGAGAKGAVLAVGCAFAPSFARLAQTLSAALMGRDFIAAARVAGVGRLRLLTRHILPNIAEPLAVNTTVGAGQALLTFAGLSFLGLGMQPPSYDWGQLMQTGLDRVYVNPAAALAPGLAVVIVGLAFNLLGETTAAVMGTRVQVGNRQVRRGSPRPTVAVPRIESAGAEEVLRVDNLHVTLPREGEWITPVRGVTFTIRPGETVGIVGESGSGKSVTALALAQLIDQPGQVRADRLEFLGTALLETPEKKQRPLLGSALAMVFQDPMSSFNPTHRVGRQIAEVAQWHQGIGRRDALKRAIDRLDSVHISDPSRRAKQYPHEFSGGMRQRAMIAMGLMGTPRLIIADEPTTALDVTVQRDVLRLLKQVSSEAGASVLLISHDIEVVAQICDRVLVMYAGRLVEDLPADRLHESARHPYTRALMATIPDLTTDRCEPLSVIPGRPPAPDQFPSGCAFADRCPRASSRCRLEDPALRATEDGHRVACWHPVSGSAADSLAVTPGGAA